MWGTRNEFVWEIIGNGQLENLRGVGEWLFVKSARFHIVNLRGVGEWLFVKSVRFHIVG